MPRNFDSSESNPVMQFTELISCPVCNQEFDGVFSDSSISVEDMVDAPCGTQVCPSCGHAWVASMSGWMFFGEAG